MYIEDYLELFAGIHREQKELKFFCSKKDEVLMFSLGKQVLRQTALTDRQHELAKKKLLEYKEQFDVYGFDDFEKDLDSLRMPIRSINRQKLISLKQINDKIYIAVRFPFSKKMIKHIEFLQRLQPKKNYDSKTKTHLIDFSEKNLFEIVSKLKDCNFEVEEDVKEIYGILKIMDDDKENNAPGIYGFEIKNLHAKAIDYAVTSIGEPNVDNLVAYKDRENLLGLKHFDNVELQKAISNLQPLTKKIMQRTNSMIFIDDNEYTFNNIVESVLELYRFPLLIVLPKDKEYDILSHTYKSFKNIIPNENISVLFRLDNDSEEGRDFNQFVKKNELNSPLDNSTKIVYISSNKIPKPLIASDWYPELGIVIKNFRLMRNIQTYIDNIDLVIHYDNVHLPWGNNKKIDKI